MVGDRFARELVAHAPDLRAVYEEHLKDCGELLPHVFMGEVTRFLLENSRDRPDRVERVLAYFECALMTGVEDAEELLVVSFAENLLGEQEALARMGSRFGRHTRRLVEKVHEE